MDAGQEMDAAVAKVIGWTEIACDGEIGEDSCGDPMCMRCGWTGDGWGGSFDHNVPIPHYSTLDADALAALDATLAKHPMWRCRIEYCAENLWFCEMFDHPGWIPENRLWYDTASTRAKAICLVLLGLYGQEA
jgi:hypothetical protein